MFEGWDNFYFLIGSASAGLIGLLFVVATLTAGFDGARASRGVTLYMTPTALHFGIVLASSAVALAPKLAHALAAGLIALFAVGGFIRSLRACFGIASPTPEGEPPHWSDIWMYGAVPSALYFALAAASIALAEGLSWAVHALAASLLALLIVAIRNAWDLVTWIAPRAKALSK